VADAPLRDAAAATAADRPPGGRARVLVVRHGPGRGRLPGYMRVLFEHMAERDPRGFASLAFWETGSPPPHLEGLRAVVFLLADPLRELYPECHREAVLVAEAARARGLRVANPPESLSRSIKSVQSRLWRDAGIPTPAHERFATAGDLDAAIAATTFPAILRGDETHCQRGVVLCRTAAEARAVPTDDLTFPGTLTPFVDTRDGWRRRDPRSIWGRYFHKKRAWVLGNRVRAHHVFFSEEPIVGLSVATLACTRQRRSSLRARIRRALQRREAAREDLRFYEHGAERGAEHADVLLRAAEVLGLSWLAIDYATTADGGIVLWEANPYPQFNAEDDPVFAAQLRRNERLTAVLGDMAAMLRDLAGPDGGAWDQALEGTSPTS